MTVPDVESGEMRGKVRGKCLLAVESSGDTVNVQHVKYSNSTWQSNQTCTRQRRLSCLTQFHRGRTCLLHDLDSSPVEMTAP